MEENSSSSGSNSSSSTAKDKASSAVTNEESLRISTSSSWTILPADRIDILESTSGSSEESSPANSSEEQKSVEKTEQSNSNSCSSNTNNKEHLNEKCKLIEDADTQAEDVSDGISIISDCESTGRISPHPFLREHLSDLNFKYESGIDLPITDIGSDQQVRERGRRTPLVYDDGAVTQAPQQASTAVVQPSNASIVGFVRLPALVQSGLTAVFYVGATLAILAFVGRLRNPEWQPIGSDRPLTEIEERMIEMELQNNLMRAEIDIMSKRMQYLNNLATGQAHAQAQAQAQSQSQSNSHGSGRKSKTFKVWPGNGNSIDPVDITKEDLKRPYKCPDGKFVEIAAMCMESKPHAESLVDEIGNVVNNVLQQSPAFQSFEKVTEQLGTLAGSDPNEPTPSTSDTSSKPTHAHGDNARPPPVDAGKRSASMPYPKYKADASKERYKRPADSSKERYKHQGDSSKERYKHQGDSSKERYKSKHNHKPHDHSKEYKRSKSSENDSKERYGRKNADKSKEKSKQRPGNIDDSGSGEWHERMMQHREQARQRHEQQHNNNWYIERGGSREQIRSGETRR